MQLQSNLAAVIFDLDGTLYDSKSIDKMNIEAAIDAIAQYNNISYVEASQIFTDARENTNTNSLLPVSITLKNLGISTIQIENSQNKIINVSKFLTEDKELSELLELLKLQYQLALFTNSNSNVVIQILKSIGVDLNVFNIIRAGMELHSPKPNVNELIRLVNDLGAELHSSIMIGDRWEVDIAPAIELGMKYLHVKNVTDLKKWIQKQLK